MLVSVVINVDPLGLNARTVEQVIENGLPEYITAAGYSVKVEGVDVHRVHEAEVDEPPTAEDTGLCCLREHANATPPWTCSCRCHRS